MGRDMLIADVANNKRDTKDMLNRSYFSAKNILVDNGLLAASTSFNLEDYELFMKTFNSTDRNFTMKSCSLSNELNSVSSAWTNLLNLSKAYSLINRGSLSGCRGYRIGIHRVYAGDCGITGCAVLVLHFFHDASGPRSGLTNRDTRRHALRNL